MKSELIVDVQSSEITIALTEDDRLMEWGQESRTEATFAVGNIYYGRVKKVMPALNAVFVDVGHEKEAFLHYLDLGSQFLTLEKFTQFAVQEKNRKPLLQKTPQQREVGKQGSIQDVCHVGQEILVQVAKEPINTKGPRLTAEISLAGRNIVLIPFGDKVMVSSKIKSEAERSRLKQLVQAIKPERFGVIVRTVAEGKRAAELDSELRLLVKRWEETVARLQKAKPVSLVTEEIGRTIGMIRDVFTPDFTSIYVNDQEMFEEVQNYVGLIAPESEKIVKLYKDDQPIFDHFGITRQMKTGLGRTVGFKNGGYLIMERTEALFSIDVNSGSKKLGSDQEDNAFQCNMLAADEIYHQLRLRDIGGIIIVDFIDMDSAEHRQLLFEHMKRLMKRDRARHNVLQLSKFGLMQITRQRVRPVVEVDVQEVCPTCGGKGRIQPSILFTDTLDEQIELYNHHFGRGLKLFVHPFVFAYANKGLFFRSLRFRWFYQYGVRLRADESLPLLEFRFVDRNGQTVELPRMTEESADKKAEKKAKLYTAKAIEEKPEVVLPKAQPVAEQTATADIAESDAEQPAAAPAAPAKAKRKRSRKKKNSDQIEETSPLEEPVSSLSSYQAEQDAEAEKVAKKKKQDAETEKVATAMAASREVALESGQEAEEKKRAKAEKKAQKKAAQSAENQDDMLSETVIAIREDAPQEEAEPAKKRNSKKSKRQKVNADASQSNIQENAAQDKPSDSLAQVLLDSNNQAQAAPAAPAAASKSDANSTSAKEAIADEALHADSLQESQSKRKKGKRVKKTRVHSATSSAQEKPVMNASELAVSDATSSQMAEQTQPAAKKAKSKKKAPNTTKQTASETSQPVIPQRAAEKKSKAIKPAKATDEKEVSVEGKPTKKRSTRKPKSKAEPSNEGSANAVPQGTALNNP